MGTQSTWGLKLRQKLKSSAFALCAPRARSAPFGQDGSYESPEGYGQGRHRGSLGKRVRVEEVRLHEGHRQLGGDRFPGGVEDWYLHRARLVQDQDAHEAGNEGGQA